MPTYSDEFLKGVLARTRRIAIVGMSTNPIRPSYFVGRYLSLKGYGVVPVNPGAAGAEIFGATVVGSLGEIDGEVDMVDIFRRSESVPEVVDEAIGLPGLRTIWMQIGVEHAGASELARSRGIDVVMDRCPKMEHQRLFGELRKAGIATGILSSKL